MAFRLCGNSHDAEEVAQETFLRVHRGLDGYRGRSSFRTWLSRITVNAARTHLSRRARRQSEYPSSDEQLDRAGQQFLANAQKGMRFGTEPGVLWGSNHVVRLSPIFDWFEQDFGSNERERIQFVLRFASPEAGEFIHAHRDELDVRDLDYDWSLNGR